VSEVLERRFAAMGARLRVAQRPWYGSPRIDVRSDRRGELFILRFDGKGGDAEVEVTDVDRRGRHLLLLARGDREKSKFLCGYDERHWFVAAVPEEARGVTGVRSAKAALQPKAVRELVGRTHPRDPFDRRKAGFVRQGEWFFMPAPSLDVDLADALRGEPLTRGRGKAHVMEYAFRAGGRPVYVNWSNRSGITEQQYAQLTPDERRGAGWQRLVRDPDVYALGTVRHPDHATITLPMWHRVLMNTERRARAMRHVVFLD
jgi:hypothetical protein